MLAHSLHWIDWWRRAAALSWSHFDKLAAFGDPRRLRNAFLDDWRALSTDCMRSPEFLALMRLNITMLTQPMILKAAQTLMPRSR